MQLSETHTAGLPVQHTATARLDDQPRRVREVLTERLADDFAVRLVSRNPGVVSGRQAAAEIEQLQGV